METFWQVIQVLNLMMLIWVIFIIGRDIRICIERLDKQLLINKSILERQKAQLLIDEILIENLTYDKEKKTKARLERIKILDELNDRIGNITV